MFSVSNQGKYSKLKMYCPCMFTTLNLLMGITVIYFMIIDRSNSLTYFVPILIIFAGFCDWLDGRLARRFGVDSKFGKELDSFADSISFGLAPVALVVHQLVGHTGFLGRTAVIAFPLAGIFRLARFNTSKFDAQYFQGLPITAAGIGLAIKHLISTALTLQGNALYIDGYITSILMLILSILMVSKINFKKI